MKHEGISLCKFRHAKNYCVSRSKEGASLFERAARLRSGGTAPVRRAALRCVAFNESREVRYTVVGLDREMYLRLAAHMPTISVMALKLKWWAVQDLNL